MHFGLKNVPANFQRNIDDCFKGTEEYLATYIDDIMIFSETEGEHGKHLGYFLDICEQEILVLFSEKIKIGVPQIDFMGVIIGGRIELQLNIIQSIACFLDEKLHHRKDCSPGSVS